MGSDMEESKRNSIRDRMRTFEEHGLKRRSEEVGNGAVGGEWGVRRWYVMNR